MQDIHNTVQHNTATQMQYNAVKFSLVWPKGIQTESKAKSSWCYYIVWNITVLVNG